jgi:hypothetical protein
MLADVFGSPRWIGFWISFILLMLFTPIIAMPIIYLFPKFPKAMCIKDYMRFQTGISYTFEKISGEGIVYYKVHNGYRIKISRYEFEEYFSPLVNQEKESKLVKKIKQYLNE